jgi:anthranilate phosphoribosyltransferase
MTSVSTASATDTFDTLLSDASSESQRADAFHRIISLPVTAELLVEAAKALRTRMTPVSLSGSPIDVCGTGGSGKSKLNISTFAAFVVAAAGAPVAKHGNRAASGKCGSFDVLEALGVRIDLTPEQEAAAFDACGIVFVFARLHHPALGQIAGLRKALGRRTMFNLLGPLCNPAGITRQLIGTGDASNARMLADAMILLGQEGMVVRGQDGLDEVSICAPTDILTVTGNTVAESVFTPSALVTEDDVAGGVPGDNARAFMDMLEQREDTPRQRLALVNAAHALIVAGKAKTADEGIQIAHEALQSGRALELFKRYRDFLQTA